MKAMGKAIVGLLWCAPALALAQQLPSPQDYRQQWPLHLADPDAAAYRLVLDAAIYQSAVSPQLADVQVFNADGQPLPAALQTPEHPATPVAAWRSLAWFPLPAATAARNDLQVLAERDADGSLSRVEARLRGEAAEGAIGGWLIDASALDQPVQVLQLEWLPQAGLQAQVQLQASDDLAHWASVADPVPLLDLQQDGRRLLQQQVRVDRRARYFRIRALDGAALPTLSAVQAQLPLQPARVAWQWRALPGRTVAPGQFEYQLDGRFPIVQAGVATAGNSAVEWTLFSRDDARQPWQRRAGPWLGYQLQQAGARDRSQARTLAWPVRDRYWKLVAAQASAAAAPTLELGYQPEVLVFLSQGRAPYAVAAGSRVALRRDAPLQWVLDRVREQQGALWQPAPATIDGPAQTLAGDAALAAPRDWKRLLLWALLLAGVLLVGGFALSLLRQGRH